MYKLLHDQKLTEVRKLGGDFKEVIFKYEPMGEFCFSIKEGYKGIKYCVIYEKFKLYIYLEKVKDNSLIHIEEILNEVVTIHHYSYDYLGSSLINRLDIINQKSMANTIWQVLREIIKVNDKHLIEYFKQHHPQELNLIK